MIASAVAVISIFGDRSGVGVGVGVIVGVGVGLRGIICVGLGRGVYVKVGSGVRLGTFVGVSVFVGNSVAVFVGGIKGGPFEAAGIDLELSVQAVSINTKTIITLNFRIPHRKQCLNFSTPNPFLWIITSPRRNLFQLASNIILNDDYISSKRVRSISYSEEWGRQELLYY